MKPRPKKPCFLAPGRADTNSRAVLAVSLQQQDRVAMGTSRAGPGWEHWFFSAHSLQLAMGSPESSGQVITDTLKERRKKLMVTPGPKLLSLHIGKFSSVWGKWHSMPEPRWNNMTMQDQTRTQANRHDLTGERSEPWSWTPTHRYIHDNRRSIPHPYQASWPQLFLQCFECDQILRPPALVQDVQAAWNTLNVFSVGGNPCFQGVFSLNAPYKGWASHREAWQVHGGRLR